MQYHQLNSEFYCFICCFIKQASKRSTHFFGLVYISLSTFKHPFVFTVIEKLLGYLDNKWWESATFAFICDIWNVWLSWFWSGWVSLKHQTRWGTRWNHPSIPTIIRLPRWKGNSLLNSNLLYPPANLGTHYMILPTISVYTSWGQSCELMIDATANTCCKQPVKKRGWDTGPSVKDDEM